MLKSKTLLIKKLWSNEEFNDTEIKKYYGYEYMICSETEFETAIINNDPRYAYFVI